VIAGLIIATATLVADLWTDYRMYLTGKPVNHIRGAWLRLIGLVPAALLIGWPGVVTLFSYWAIFDVCYALLIGQKWNYIGTTSWLDKQQRVFPGLVWLKFIGAGASIITAIIYA
jgi:hypothetical protein